MSNLNEAVPEFEKDVGICVYATKFPGLGGLIKYRYEDFLINELSMFRSARGSGKYLYMMIEKRGINHYDMVMQIARLFGVKLSDIGVAGIKDARAVARQLISVKGITLENALNSLRKAKKIRVLWAGYGYGPVKPGMLIGNSFIITIRKIEAKASYEEIEERIKTLSTSIIPNFYGHQRFGLPRYSSHLVGRSMVYGDYREAVRMFVGNPFPGEPEDVYLARKIYDETEDPKKTLTYLPKNMVYERLVLRYLLKNPGDYVGAMFSLPLSLLKLLVEAYASYLFNRFLCERLRLNLGLKRPVDGDLIAPVDSHGNPVRRVFEVGGDLDFKRAIELIEKRRAVLVLPLPGYKIRLSKGIQGEIEEEILKSEEVSLGDFKVLGTKKLGIKGDYRRPYMIFRDLRVLEYREDEVFPGAKKLKLGFVLTRGEYATILLRELMKSKDFGAYIGMLSHRASSRL